MFKETIYTPLALGDRFNVAFPDNRIPNGYIDKTKTRIGITYTGFHDDRNSISIIPSVPIIEDALANYPYLNLFEIKHKVTPVMIAEYLQSNAKYKRIVTTPESFGKIITATKNIGKLQWLYDESFLYLDEVHCYATEAFRDDILIPFDFEYDYVWKFKNMAMGTATSFKFSDPRIKNMQQYKITYKEKFGKITIVNNYSPQAIIHQMLTHPDMFPGNVHIFFNSVTVAGEVIRAAGISNVNIYCRDDERNMGNLQDASVFFKDKPIEGDFQKFNFYSCRYNEGWDLKDEKTATIILLTDVRIPHSLIGIPFKGFQAVGQLKVTPHQIYHITNNHGKGNMKSFESIQQKHLYNAANYIALYNKHIADCKQDNIEDDGKLKLIKSYTGFKNDIAELYYMGLDQDICAEFCKEHYNNVNIIKETWESLNYDAEIKVFDLEPIVRIKKTQEEINQQVIEHFETWRINPDQYEYGIAETTISKYKIEFAPLYEAYIILGADEIKNLGYNDKAMKTALIETSNKNAEAKIRLMLIDKFKIGNRYTKKYMKEKLQELYDLRGIKKPNGKREIATAEKLNALGLFQLNECKLDDESGKKAHGYEIIGINFTLKLAA